MAEMSAKSINDLPDSAFAYIEPGGTKDADGKTTPRSKRHFPIHDAAHIRNALARMSQSPHGQHAKAKILAAARKHGIEVGDMGRSGICLRSFDFEARGSDDGRTLEGYAAVFDSPTRIRDMKGPFEETIRRGAFKRSLKQRMPVLQWDHGRDPAVGTAPIGDIEDVREDDHGLFVRAKLYDHPSTERVRLAIKGRSVRGMSFRFEVAEGGEKWSQRDGMDLRDITDADVHELGPVAFPAYNSTSVTVRSMLTGLLDPDEYRALLVELAADLRNLPDLAGRSTRGVDGGDPVTVPAEPTVPTPHLRQRLDDGALRARGIVP